MLLLVQHHELLLMLQLLHLRRPYRIGIYDKYDSGIQIAAGQFFIQLVHDLHIVIRRAFLLTFFTFTVVAASVSQPDMNISNVLMVFGIICGDKRQLYLAEEILSDGYLINLLFLL